MLGDRLLTGDDSNPTGHYEDQDFLQFHKDVLEDNGTDYLYHGTPPLQLSPYHQERAKALVGFKNKLYPQWGWKEPRTCLFTDLYQELLPRAKYLVLVRPPHKVINSLMQRDWTSIEHSLRDHPVKRWYKSYFLKKERTARALRYALTWQYYNQQLLRFLSSVPQEDCLLVTTEDVKKHSSLILERLQDWNFQLTPYPIESILFEKTPGKKEHWSLSLQLQQELEELHEQLLQYPIRLMQ
jgi:hypothetical protein